MLWIDKHKPESINQLAYHEALSRQLKTLATSNNVPHILFHGPSGSGKKTRIAALLKEMFGPALHTMKINQRAFNMSYNSTFTITVISSSCHVEIDASELGLHDRAILQEMIKDMAKTPNINPQTKHGFKVFLIRQADLLTHEAQAALRRTMEKYSSNVRLIFCSDNLSKIISAVRSRCLLIRVARPSVDEVIDVLHNVAAKENLEISRTLARNIAEQSKCSLHEAILTLQSLSLQTSSNLRDVQTPEMAHWKGVVANIATQMRNEPNMSSVLPIRSHLYNMISQGIPPSLIIKTLAFDLFKAAPDAELRRLIMNKAAYHEYRLAVGNKSIFHLEAFVSAVMNGFQQHIAPG